MDKPSKPKRIKLPPPTWRKNNRLTPEMAHRLMAQVTSDLEAKLDENKGKNLPPIIAQVWANVYRICQATMRTYIDETNPESPLRGLVDLRESVDFLVSSMKSTGEKFPHIPPQI